MQELSRGRELARAMIARAAPHAALVKKKLDRPASVAILAGEDEDSRRFVQIKRDMLVGVDFDIEPVWLGTTASTDEVVAIIADLNQRADVDAVFLQFPLPPQLDAYVLSNALHIAKDIDCSSERGEEAFLTGAGDFIPVAPLAALDLLRHELGSLNGRRVVVYGEEDAFTRALEELLRRDGAATLASLEGKLDALVVTGSLPDADVCAAADGIDVVLDAGYYMKPRRNDWMPARLRGNVRVYLTQYGNVGPMTVAHLARATIEAADSSVTR